MIELPLVLSDTRPEYTIKLRDPQQDIAITLAYNGRAEFRDVWSLGLKRAGMTDLVPAPVDVENFNRLAGGSDSDRRLLRLALLEQCRFLQWRNPERVPLPLIHLLLVARTGYERWEALYAGGLFYKTNRKYEQAIRSFSGALKMLDQDSPDSPLSPSLRLPAEYFTRILLAQCLNARKQYAAALPNARAARGLYMQMLDWGELPDRYLGHWGAEGCALEGLARWPEAAYKYLEASELPKPRLYLLYRLRRLMNAQSGDLTSCPDIYQRYQAVLRRAFPTHASAEADQLLVAMFSDR